MRLVIGRAVRRWEGGVVAAAATATTRGLEAQRDPVKARKEVGRLVSRGQVPKRVDGRRQGRSGPLGGWRWQRCGSRGDGLLWCWYSPGRERRCSGHSVG